MNRNKRFIIATLGLIPVLACMAAIFRDRLTEAAVDLIAVFIGVIIGAAIALFICQRRSEA